ncbi:uncharacterized protein HD556DRAFT_1309273 [Suillus plorans]|uniref:DUF6534 domain-containing protein n=1 Tax=Suillus plorans TaxID=116603 RepID=A0A9P7AMD3_9AGAM|nr:uncharacterized protein HD556DRAFT_1309273 [Suillus plorans]KAG1792438.1 hypothetical protein HD556DRAFT_1309273 [Suillus plorans]
MIRPSLHDWYLLFKPKSPFIHTDTTPHGYCRYFGAFLIGVVVSAASSQAHKVTCVQTWYYFSWYFSDPWYNKLLVGAVFVSDTTHQALITHALYTYLVTDFGNASDLEKIVWSLLVEVLFNGFTGFMVQSFLAKRVYHLSNKNMIITASVMSVVIAELVIVVIYVVKALELATFTQVRQIKSWSMSINAVAAAGDILIAVLLCIFLQRSRTGFRRSDTMINKLMLYTINTGLLTSVCAMMSFISVCKTSQTARYFVPDPDVAQIVLWPDTFIYIAFYFCVGRLNCNSLLATLNARKGIRRDGDACNEHVSTLIDRALRPINSPISSSQMEMPNHLSIKLDTTQECIEDQDLKRAHSSLALARLILDGVSVASTYPAGLLKIDLINALVGLDQGVADNKNGTSVSFPVNLLRTFGSLMATLLRAQSVQLLTDENRAEWPKLLQRKLVLCEKIVHH